MPFEMSKSAKKYFETIQKNSKTGKFKVDFDFYYLCAVLGMQRKKISECENCSELIKHFPNPYREYSKRIIALLLSAEIERLGANTDDREALERFMLDYVKADNPAYLTPSAVNIMNKYAEGGYEIIMEEIGQMDDLFSFLKRYHELLNKSGSGI